MKRINFSHDNFILLIQVYFECANLLRKNIETGQRSICSAAATRGDRTSGGGRICVQTLITRLPIRRQ